MRFTLHSSPTAPPSSVGRACPWEHAAHRWAQVSISTCWQPSGRGCRVAAGQGEDDAWLCPTTRPRQVCLWMACGLGPRHLWEARACSGRAWVGSRATRSPGAPLCSCFGGGPVCSLCRVLRRALASPGEGHHLGPGAPHCLLWASCPMRDIRDIHSAGRQLAHWLGLTHPQAVHARGTGRHRPCPPSTLCLLAVSQSLLGGQVETSTVLHLRAGWRL